MPEPAKEALEEDEGPESDEPLLSRAEAESRGDAEALREIAKSHRSGTRGVAKDMKACFDCYEAAAKLGDPESHYALALFLFTGGVVPADNKAAATHLRAAADGGLVDARVYLANLYELGIHYRADQDKADVWVRSAARAAGLDDAAVDFERRMAALGVVRFAKPLIDDDATSPEERDALLRKMKARGFSLKLREERESVVPSRTPPPVAVNVDGSPPSTSAVLQKADTTSPKASPEPEEKPAPRKTIDKSKSASSLTLGRGAWAFGYMIVFSIAAFGAGYLASEGGKVLHESSGAVPLFGHRVALVFPSVVAALLVIPSMLVYRMRTVLSALLVGAAAAAVGVHLHGTPAGHVMSTVELQGLAFGAGAFLGTLLVFGMLGGAKPKSRLNA